MVHKVLCTGDRRWTRPRLSEKDYKTKLGLWLSRQELVREIFSELPWKLRVVVTNEIMIVHGGARGVDSICDRMAKEAGYTISAYPAEWDKYGMGAGPIRNRQMLDNNTDIELVLAFHDEIENSKGTLHMCQYAATKGYPVLVYRSDRTFTSFSNNSARNRFVYGRRDS